MHIINRNELLETFEAFGLRPIFKEPSRITNNSGTCIDNIFSNLESHTYLKDTYDPHLSDHLVQEIKLHTKIAQEINTTIRHNINEENTKKFILALKLVNWDALMEQRAEDSYKNFDGMFQHCFNDSFPRIAVRERPGRKHNTRPNNGISALKRAIEAAQTIHRVQKTA
ncbi:hypothetical protein HHI36_009761 [Cryptolaemus montrouzieri]|uniref:Uncharacterized protein n=1 Tax=Cryptolaemus montrouzieri TaxID=559131 RepID=A0ABD2MHE8_9CUCU